MKWISVKDRLPFDGVRVIVNCERFDRVEVGMYHADVDLYGASWVSDYILALEVTHWMPLPEWPKEKDGLL